MFQKRLVSVIIINFNGKEFLKRLFSSLLRTNYREFEIILVDNASSDGSIEFVKESFKDNRIAIIVNDKNLGPSAARNIGFGRVKGEFVAFLDNDTEVDSEWLSELVKVFDSDSKIAVAQCKLLDMVERNRFDYAGDYLTPFGFLYERAQHNVDRGQFDSVEDIFSAKSAATMIKSSIYKELGMHDDSYFIFMEETDFCFRAWLAGYRVVFVPKAIVWHAYNTSLKEFKKYYTSYMVRFCGCRNYIMTLLKNLSLGNLLRILPFHILIWCGISLIFLLKGRLSDSIYILRGIFWNLFNIRIILRKRKFVQKVIRKVDDNMIFKYLMIKQPFNFYLRKAVLYLRGTKY